MGTHSNIDHRKQGGMYVLTLAGTPPSVYEIVKSVTTIGRSVDCDIRIDEPNISRLHAEVQITPEGCQITNCSANGTLVNNQKITTYLLQPGDEIVIGSTVLTFSVEETRSWVFPQRTAFRCVQLTLLSGLFCAILLGYPLDKVATYWGNAWDDMIANARAGMPSLTVTEARSPRPEIRNQPPARKLSPENVARETPSEPDRRQQSNDFEIQSRHAVETLRKNIMDDLAAKDLELAEVHLESFKKGEFYSHHFNTVRELEEKITAVKRGMTMADKERMARLDKRWKSVEAKFREAVSAEQFDSAGDPLRDVLNDPDLGSRAKALLASIENLKEQHVKETLPRRRDLFTELLLKLRPFLQKRDYAAAVGYVKTSLMNDPTFASHRPMLEREREQLEKAGDLYGKIISAVGNLPNGKKVTIELKDERIMEGKPTGIKDGHLWLNNTMGYKLTDIVLKFLVALTDVPDSSTYRLLYLSILYLYDEEFENASLAVVESMGKVSPESGEDQYAAANDLLIRLEMTRNALKNIDLENAFAEADKNILLGKYDKAKEFLDGVGKKYAVPQVAFGDHQVASGDPQVVLADGAPEQLPGLDEAYDRLEKAQEAKMAGHIPASRLKIFKEKEKSEEKATLLKNLKVAGDKEVIPFILLALRDEASRVRLEAVRTLSVLGNKENIWDLIGAVGDPIKEVGYEAVEAIRKIGYNPESIRRQYEKGSAEEKRLAVILAGHLRDEKLSSIAREGLESADWQTRMESAIALAKIKDKGAGSSLVTALKKESADDVASAIAYAMGAIKYTSGIKPIADLLKSKPDHPYKKELLRAISAIGGSNADDILKPYIRDLDPWVRSTALEGIVESGGKLTLKEAKPLLADDNWLVRAGALKGLIAGESDEALDTLVLSLDDQNAAVRATVHHGLKSWKNGKVIPAILKRIEGLGAEGSGLAYDILKGISGKEFATLSEWKQWWQTTGGNVRLVPVEERFKPKVPVQKK